MSPCHPSPSSSSSSCNPFPSSSSSFCHPLPPYGQPHNHPSSLSSLCISPSPLRFILSEIQTVVVLGGDQEHRGQLVAKTEIRKRRRKCRNCRNYEKSEVRNESEFIANSTFYKVPYSTIMNVTTLMKYIQEQHVTPLVENHNQKQIYRWV